MEQFAFIAAHNLRAPVARILGLANIIELSSKEEDRDQALRKIVSSSKDLDSVVKDLTSILDIQKQTSNFTSVDLKPCLERVIKTLEKELEETDALITSDIDSTPTVYAVSPYIESILYNLISNAIKYRVPDRPPIIHITTERSENEICLTVSDNGLGIDLTAFRDKLFTLYSRFHIHLEGKGLGLYLVKTQITAMGGRIEIDSEVNKGSTFRVYFKS